MLRHSWRAVLGRSISGASAVTAIDVPGGASGSLARADATSGNGHRRGSPATAWAIGFAVLGVEPPSAVRLRALRPREHGAGRMEHGTRPFPRHHARNGRADESARVSRRSDSRALRARDAAVSDARDARRRPGRRSRCGRLARPRPRPPASRLGGRRRFPSSCLSRVALDRLGDADRFPSGRARDHVLSLRGVVPRRGPLRRVSAS